MARVINFPNKDQKQSSNLGIDGNLALDRNNNFNEEENDNKNLPNKAKRVVGTGMQTAGRGMQVAGTTAQVAGKGTQVAGRGAEIAGKGVQVAGKGVQVAGKGINVGSSAVGGAMTAIPYVGPAIGGAIKAVGQGVGTGVEVAGKGVESAGKIVNQTGQSINKTGKNINRTGKSIKNIGGTINDVGYNIKSRDGGKKSNILAQHDSLSQLKNLSPLGGMYQKRSSKKNNQKASSSNLKLGFIGQANKSQKDAKVHIQAKSPIVKATNKIKDVRRIASRQINYKLYQFSWQQLIPTIGLSYFVLLYLFIAKYIAGSKSFPHFVSLFDPTAEKKIITNTDKLDIVSLLAFFTTGAVIGIILLVIFAIVFWIIYLILDPIDALIDLSKLSGGVIKMLWETIKAAGYKAWDIVFSSKQQ